MALTFEPATVASRTTWSEGLYSIVLDTTVPFKAGQFVTLSCDPDGGRDARRAYSIASAPGQPLEFYIVEVEDGRVSPGLCNLQPGDPLFTTTRGKGLFVLDDVPEDGSTDLWMMATGTGLAPFLSMLREGTVLDRFERIVVCYGARRWDQLGYLDELRALEIATGRVRVLPMVTRETPQAGGLAGRVTALLRAGALELAAGCTLAPGPSHVMLCGNPAMITEVIDVLAERGMQRHTRREPGHITTEKYW